MTEPLLNEEEEKTDKPIKDEPVKPKWSSGNAVLAEQVYGNRIFGRINTWSLSGTVEQEYIPGNHYKILCENSEITVRIPGYANVNEMLGKRVFCTGHFENDEKVIDNMAMFDEDGWRVVGHYGNGKDKKY